MPHIVFRADASTAIGAGHVARCATLAGELAARGATVRFLCREQAGDYCDWLERQGFAVSRLQAASAEEDIEQSRQALAALAPVDWLVVDHYGLDQHWQSALRPFAERLMAIDDRPWRAHDCDLFLDQNFAPGAAEAYRRLLPRTADCLLGPRYALLRPEFLAARNKATPRDGGVRRLLVCFGGSDPHGHTLATVRALHAHAHRLTRIDVVVGPANPAADEIAAVCMGFPSIRMHRPANDLAGLLAEADLAIGAGGTMNWERACLGVPSLAFGIADNQRPVLEALLEGGHVVGESDMAVPDPARIAGWLAILLDNPPLLRGLSARSAALVDGLGVRRVADRLLPAAMDFRPASAADSADLLRWRNDPAIRAVSLDIGEIDAATHSAWLSRTLADPQRLLLIAERGRQALGVIRFDLAPPQAVISVYRVPGQDAPGLVHRATDWLRRQHPEIRRIVAEVRPDNATSLAAFRGAGYIDVKNTLVNELEPS